MHDLKKSKEALVAELQLLRKQIADQQIAQTAIRDFLWKLPVPVYETTVDGRFQYVNAALVDLLGYDSAEELLAIDLAHDLYLSSYARQQMRRVFDQVGRTDGMELLLKKKNGENLPILIYSRNLYDAHRQICGYQGVLLDARIRTEYGRIEKEEELRYRIIAENTAVGMWRLAPNGQTLYLNQAICRMLEIDDLQAVLGRSFWSFIAPDRLAEVQSQHDQRRAGITSIYETEVVSLSGRRRPVLVSAAPVFGSDGNLDCVVGTAVDITDRKRAEQSLRESEQRYRMLIETMNEGVTQIDLQGNIQFINQRFCEFLGYTYQEIIGKNVSDYLYNDEMRQFLFDRLPHRVAGVAEAYELALRHKNGGVVWLQASVSAMVDGQGKVIGSIGVHIDITQRRQVEQALRESEHLTQTIIASVGEGIIVYDRALRCQVWNQHMEMLTGLTADEALQETAVNLFTQPQQSKHLPLLQQALAGETVYSDDTYYHIKTTDKKGWFVGIYSPLIDLEGRTQGVVASIQDVTMRKEAEAALAHAQKLESLGIMAGGLAHDFNNLLVAMMGQSSLALAQLDDTHPAHRAITKVVKVAERATDLTLQILAYAGQGHTEKRPLQLNTLINDNLEFLTDSLPAHVHLEADLAVNLPLIKADAGQMQQVVMNLIINAADALTDQPGVIQVATKKESAPTELRDNEYVYQDNLPDNDEYVTLTVSDNGSGMNQETLSRIFDPFFTTKFTGRGLGLATVMGIVKGHSGGLWVTSEVGKGTTFKLFFPIFEEEWQETAVYTTSPEVTMQQSIVLIIDDEEPVREAVTDILEFEQITVLTAASGAKGLEIYQERRDEIQLILLDLSMPGMSGEETLYNLHQIDSEIKVILSSGYTEAEIPHEFEGLGVVDFLQKPYDLVKLVTVIRRHL